MSGVCWDVPVARRTRDQKHVAARGRYVYLNLIQDYDIYIFNVYFIVYW